ncbi:MAG TPA: sensor histidine kinase, partial [Spirochaetia bacterium]|nr:sensor histidine kinase [Spirochaetia bacterium]
AFVAVAGVGLAEVLDQTPYPRLMICGALLLVFAAGLVINFGHFYRPSRTLFTAIAVIQTASAIGVMVAGASPLFGAILFFVLNTVIAVGLPQPVALAWGAVPVVALTACLLLRGERDWFSTVLTFSAGFFAFIAFALALRQAQTARAESQQLLEELTGTQGRLREMAVLEERQRLAREMHDAVGHRLTAASVLLEGAARLIRGDPDRATRMVETSREQVKEGLAEIRAAVSALREEPAGSRPLPEVLRALVDVFAQASPAEVTLAVDDGLEPDTERKNVIVRTAQEALTNVQKHASASRVQLRLQMIDGAYVLSCRDNGRGPGSRADNGSSVGGFGLPNLQERASSFGGSVELTTAPEGGALLRLVLPKGETHG